MIILPYMGELGMEKFKSAIRLMKKAGHLLSDESQHRIWQIICIVTVAFCCAPLLVRGLPMGTDDTYHLGRVYSLGEAIRNGIFPAQIRPSLCYRYGYGEGFFYPDFFLYVPALFLAIGVPAVIVIKAYVFMAFLAIIFFMYLMVKKITGNTNAALICACLYVLSNKVFGQYHLEFSIGCFTAAAFVPLAIGGLYLILQRDAGWRLFMIGCIGCVGSHVITTFLVGIICLLMLCLTGKQLLFDKRRCRKFLFCIMTMLLLTGAYWLPMLEQFHTSRMKSSFHWTLEENNIASFRYMIEYRGIGIGIVMTGALLLVLMGNSVIHKRCIPDGTLIFSGLGFLFMLLPSWKYFWHFINLKVSLIQFPHRLYQPAAALILLAFGCMLSGEHVPEDSARIVKRRVCISVICIGLIGISMASDIKEYYMCPEINYGYDSLELVQNGTIACAGAGQEWMPLEVNTDKLNEPEVAIGASGQQVKGEKSKGDSVFSFKANLTEKWYDLPFIHYQGYRAVDENGQEYITTGDPENGLLRILLSENLKGPGEKEAIITVSYERTKWQTVGYILSALGVFVVIFSIIMDLVEGQENLV